jgi:hypothetical protein
VTRTAAGAPALLLLAVLAMAGGRARAADQTTCVDVTVNGQKSYNCENERLRQLVPPHRASAADAPYGVNSPVNELGGYTQAGTREHLGAAFGHSAIPSRPPPQVFVSPLVTGHGH